MERFVIEGGHRLSGTIRPAGNKNAALPLLAATLLTSEPVILRNMPEIGDVVTKRALLGGLGVHISPAGDHSWRFHTPEVRNEDPDPALARRIRTLPLPIRNSCASLVGSMVNESDEEADAIDGDVTEAPLAE